MLLARITPPRDLAVGKPVTLDADVSFLVCEKICIPGEASLSLAARGLGCRRSPPNRIFEDARAKLPQASPWSATFDADNKHLTLSLRSADLQSGAIRSAAFFPLRQHPDREFGAANA